MGRFLPAIRFPVARAVLNRQTIHVADMQALGEEYREAIQQQLGHRTTLATPLLKDGVPLGAILIRRMEVKPFTDKQIALLETFADQAVIAIENTRLFEAEQTSKRELQESLEYQTAISDVLNVISRSPNDLQPVFDIIAQSASRLCGGEYAIVTRYDGGLVHLVAQHNPRPGTAELTATLYPLPADHKASITSRAIATISVIHVPDVELENLNPTSIGLYRRISARAILAVPMVHKGQPIGTVSVSRASPGPFSDRQIELLKTFADQAVIAIENTRLFEAEQASKQELQESLEYQTSISEVLGVISRSPTDAQPVFDSIAQSATHLCGAQHCNVFKFDGRLIHFAATHLVPGMPPEAREANLKQPPIAPGRGNAAARSIAYATVAEIPDIDADPDYERKDVTTISNLRSTMGIPMLKDGHPIGAIVVSRSEKGRFSEQQIKLLQTFADQAVIAIENARLFEEAQARNRDLSEALEQQTATSEVLKVIGRSTFELQPVLETLVENATRLCDASTGIIFRLDGEVFRWLADYGSTPALRDYQQQNPIIAGRGSVIGRAALHRQSIQIADALQDPEFQPLGHQKVGKFRTLLGVPMLRGDVLLGVFSLQRQEVRPFTNKQIELVETFADQAVIAIENVRLLNEAQSRTRELARSVQELQALGEVGRAVSSTLDLKVVLKTIVDRAVQLSGTDAGSIFYYRKEIGTFQLGETTGLDELFVARLSKLDISARETGLGEAIVKRQPLQIPNLAERPSDALRDAVLEAGFHASLIVPLLSAEEPLGTLILRRRQPGEFSEAVISLMQTFADQSAIALENARLFEEIAQKSRELEIASQHKSQFVANMSHELRTPLAAILGYAELMQEGFYEPLGQKSLDALTRIRSNGSHLLGLINTVLDIAKIESGQFTLNMAEYTIESVVETVRAATESLAQNKKLILKTEVAKCLPIGLGDEQRLTQVLLNLVGNAIKFTDKGEVCVSAATANSHFSISVADTGPGIPKEHQARIFEQFHQVDSSMTNAKGGTGLGLAIAKQIVEMHGGQIWVVSTPGKGSTFQMELPTRAQFHKKTP